MYYLDEIMDRTFDSWSKMLGANDVSFWGSSIVEIKPAPETETTIETPAWEPADSNDWELEDKTQVDIETKTQVQETTGVMETHCETESVHRNQISDGDVSSTSAIYNLTDTARGAVEDLLPFDDETEN